MAVIQFFVPNLGTLMFLAEPWTFKLYFERRNITLLKAVLPTLNDKRYGWYHAVKETDFSDGEFPDNLKWEPAMTEEQLADAYKSYAATNKSDKPYVEVTLPVGTQLSVARIYVKQGGESFNSITFRTTKICPDKKLASKRFWVKLKDANTIMANVIG